MFARGILQLVNSELRRPHSELANIRRTSARSFVDYGLASYHHQVEHEPGLFADAIFKRKITQNPLSLVPFLEWLGRLESNAGNANEETVKCIASGEMSSEAGDFTPFSTVVAQGVSPTVKKLEWLPSMDAER
ncbi:hypothetical protein M405DRAFT_883047 [Rhizopogon salebrosus TDB-379]|nr:hypothetical protein M405DRAFT_883047 [Rhizopogon salebrosus TDB-379]